MNRLIAAALALATVPLAGCGDDGTTATCASASTDLAIDIWTDVDGCDIDVDVVRSQPGDPACGWELVDEIVIGDDVYHWDPVNLLAYVDQRVRNRTFRTADVIGDLTDSGWRRDGEELWRDPDDPSAVFLVRGDQTDRYLLDADNLIVCAR